MIDSQYGYCHQVGGWVGVAAMLHWLGWVKVVSRLAGSCCEGHFHLGPKSNNNKKIGQQGLSEAQA